MGKNKVIHEFQKNSLEQVKIDLGSYMDKELIRIWCYYKSVDDEWKPCKAKGISMLASHLPELKRGIDKAYKEWKKRKQ